MGNSDQGLGPHDTRDSIVDFVRRWSERTEIPTQRFITWLGVAASKFHDWSSRYGLANEHNALVPRDWWLEPREKAAILDFHAGHPLEGYRRLAFMMLDADVVAVSPSSVYRVLRDAGLMKLHNNKPSLKGKGFQQPLSRRQLARTGARPQHRICPRDRRESAECRR